MQRLDARQLVGRLDIAFNNAGIASFGPIEQMGVDEFDQVMATNVRASSMAASAPPACADARQAPGAQPSSATAM